MRKIILIAVTLMVVGGNISASQGAISGNQILETCKKSVPVAMGICVGYVNGASQGLEFFLRVRLKGKKLLICIPPKVTVGQQQDIFIKHLKNNPKDRHMTAFTLFVESMREAYPCPK